MPFARRRSARSPLTLVTVCLALTMSSVAFAHECENGTFDSTFDMIQKVIFEERGCASSFCHDSAQQGGLDLRAGAAYDNLVDVEAVSVDDYIRVRPGQKDASLLWVNLAAATFPEEWQAPKRAMPFGGLPLTENELETVRLWIETGAPRNGVVSGTEDLLDACLPAPEPLEIEPLPPPAADTGVQIRMPPWTLEAQSEREVCFASYYDITDQVPPEFRGPEGDTFRFNRNEIRQTPLSHHLIVSLYKGTAEPNSPEWGTFLCRGGERDGETCDPVDIDSCGAGAFCATEVTTSVACIGFGPRDSGLGLNSSGFTGTQETSSLAELAPGVYREVPLKGMILWNHHAFNLTDEDGSVDAWMNFDFAPPEEQTTPVRIIFNTDDIFAMSNPGVPAFGTLEVCSLHEFEDNNTYLYELSSHAHRHMKRWRTFKGAFRCDGGRNRGKACDPLNHGEDETSPDMCPEGSCVSWVREHVGDCNTDDSVTVDEVVTGVTIALGEKSTSACYEMDGNFDEQVTVDEILTAITAALNGVPPPFERDPEESLLYVSRIYNDPVQLRFDPPLVFPGRGSPAEERTLTYCALYDNGFSDPAEVKTRATSPPPPSPFAPGGPCTLPTHCTEGKVEEPCRRSLDEDTRNASCDTSPGAGDGFCDACPVLGGVTTEDEMFILMGQFYER